MKKKITKWIHHTKWFLWIVDVVVFFPLFYLFGVCVEAVSEWCHEHTHTELHSMCLCNLNFYILFFLTGFFCVSFFPLSLFVRRTRFFRFRPTSVSLLNCFFFLQFSDRVFNLFFFMIIVAFTLMWKMSNRDKTDFFSTGVVYVYVCVCAYVWRFYFAWMYEFWFVVAIFFFFFFLSCSGSLVYAFFSLFLLPYVLQMERMLFRKFTPSPRKHTFVWCG